MTFLTYIILGCLLMIVNLRGCKFEKVTKEKYPELEKKMIEEGMQPIQYSTMYKMVLALVIASYALL